MTAPAGAPRPRTARLWFVAAAIAGVISVFAIVQGKTFREAQLANQAYRFSNADIVLARFNSISTQIEVDKWLPQGPRDIVKDPEPIALYIHWPF